MCSLLDMKPSNLRPLDVAGEAAIDPCPTNSHCYI